MASPLPEHRVSALFFLKSYIASYTIPLANTRLITALTVSDNSAPERV